MPGAAAERPAFRLLFCLDITGSMGCQLDGCKEAISQLVKLSEDLQVRRSIPGCSSYVPACCCIPLPPTPPNAAGRSHGRSQPPPPAPRPRWAMQVPVTYVISTFTEAEKERACCTSLAEFATAAEAEAYVRAISLCQPPEQPGLNAGGDDGPENHKVLGCMML